MAEHREIGRGYRNMKETLFHLEELTHEVESTQLFETLENKLHQCTEWINLESQPKLDDFKKFLCKYIKARTYAIKENFCKRKNIEIKCTEKMLKEMDFINPWRLDSGSEEEKVSNFEVRFKHNFC